MTTPTDKSEVEGIEFWMSAYKLAQDQLTDLRAQVEALHADGAVMRGALEEAKARALRKRENWKFIDQSLSADAGRDLLARYREAVDLVKCCREALKHERVFLEDYLKSHTHPGVSRLVGDNRGAVQWADTLLAIVKVSNLVRGGE